MDQPPDHDKPGDTENMDIRNKTNLSPTTLDSNILQSATETSLDGPDFEKSIVHMFLTKQTPDKLDESGLPNVEKNMLLRVTNSFRKAMTESKFMLLTPIQVMLDKWVELQPYTCVNQNHVGIFMAAVEGLKVGNSIPIYVRQQNCTMIISKILINGKNKVRVQTFRASLPSELVMSNVGSLIMNFPETSNIVEGESMLSSKIFASHIYEMATEMFEISMGTTEKAGNVFLKSRDVFEPFLVSELAVGTLAPRDDPTSLSVTKKIRDHITLASQHSRSYLPFRRSGMWMSIKVVLHLKILEVVEGDENTAKLVYKIVMIQILADACNSYKMRRDKIDLDMTSQMMAKVGRRVEKLRNLTCKHGDYVIRIKLEQMRSVVLKHTLEVLTSLQNICLETWNQVTLFKEANMLQPIIRSKEYLENDLLHQIPPLEEFVKDANQNLENPMSQWMLDADENGRQVFVERLRKRRCVTFYDAYNMIQTSAATAGLLQHDQLRIWLHDTEQLIKNFDGKILFPSLEEIFYVGLRYISEAREVYADNPIGLSQLFLVSLKFTQVLDKIATNRHPLLLEYKTDINHSAFDFLLLPHESDVNLLNELLDYFNDRDGKSSYPFLERKVDQNTFSVRYVEGNQEMIQLKSTIKSDIEKAKQEKTEELERTREECRNLEKEIHDLAVCSCKYEERENTFWDRHLRKTRKFKVTCNYCILKRDFNRIRKSVTFYEIPLPLDSQTHYQNAVVFELMIPEEISLFRQFLAILRYELLGEKALNEKHAGQIYHWIEYQGLMKYTLKAPMTISLIGIDKPSSYTSLTKRTKDVLLNKNEDFIIDNGMYCSFYYDDESRESFKTNPKDQCSFLLKNTNTQAYVSLQTFMSSVEHSQNDVIARQSECDPRLSLEEYVSFGSLRAGHRIQLRNLYRAVSSRSLSLNEEPVLALILQTIWQVGPRRSNGVRESHLDFKEDAFAKQFLKLLEQLVESNESNYSSPLVLLTAIVITGRIMEVNTKCQRECYELFTKWRELANLWFKKIEDGLTAWSTVEPNQFEKGLAYKNLHRIKMCFIMTYNTYSRGERSNVCKDSGDMAHFLKIISNMELLLKESNTRFSSFMTNLRFVEQLIPARLNIGMGLEGRVSIAKIINEKFPQASKYLEESNVIDNVVTVKLANQLCVFINTLNGEIFVNGCPEREFSSQIINANIELQRFFQKHLNFRVQRLSNTVLRTCDPFYGRHYEFRTKNDMSLDILVEIQDHLQRLLLIPHDTFRGFICDSFIDNYTHWLDPVTESIFFRRIAMNENDYDLPPDYVLTRWKNGWKFCDENNQQNLVCIKSDGFALLTKSLSKMELAKYINVLTDSQMTVVAHLTRHNLRFILQSNGLLESLEFPGFQISLEQHSTGTFIGLQNYLLLQNGEKKIAIIPYGNLTIWKQSPGLHHHCKVRLESLTQPTFYIYEFDEVLKRVIARKNISSWLYLASLHAVTSSSQPDPFTGMTGTEMAVSILQSARVWSCSPYDENSLKLLKFIKDLSPKRKYYGHGSQKKGLKEEFEATEWPIGIPAIVANDVFALLVNHLVHDSVRLQTLHPIPENGMELYADLMEDDSSEKLLMRAYLRNCGKHSDEMMLDEHVTKPLKTKLFQEREYSLPFRTDNKKFDFNSLLTTGYISHLSSIPDSLPQALHVIMTHFQKDALSAFLFTDQSLLTNLQNSLIGTLTNLLNQDLRTNWLMYYSLAISEKVDNQDFNAALNALAYSGAPVTQLAILHFVRLLVNWKVARASFPLAPSFQIDSIDNPTQFEFDGSEIIRILREHTHLTLEDEYLANFVQRLKSIWQEQGSGINNGNTTCLPSANGLVIAQSYFPVLPQIPEAEKPSGINSSAVHAMELKMLSWHLAKHMQHFILAVQEQLNMWYDFITSVNQQQKLESNLAAVNNFRNHTAILSQLSEARRIKLNELLNENSFDLNDSNVADFTNNLELGGLNGTEQNEDVIRVAKAQCELHIRTIENIIHQSLSKTDYNQILQKSGLGPRLNPVNLLRYLQNPCGRSHKLMQYVGALGVLWTKLKRYNRCLNYQLHIQTADLQKELDNPGHENWSPLEHPEWLLIELELDIMIRKVQVEVANQMMHMPEGKNGVMQMNMGEGKTSVIVPMLCSVLATEDQLCRVTVLSSLFKMNWNILKFAVGGLLNRRLYSFPCQRDMEIDEARIDDIQAMYNECMRMRGVVLTLPENRLSFRLLSYDKILKGSTSLGLKLLETEDWLRWHARDILDESDELLSVKYQLVYTVSNPIQIDGGDVRWIVCQNILQIVQNIASDVFENDVSNFMEYDQKWKARFPHEFASLRLLPADGSDEFLRNFQHSVVQQYLNTIMSSISQKKSVLKFLLTKDITSEFNDHVISFLQQDPLILNKILLLAGYIRQGVLTLALSKRWRVEYGVDRNGLRKMAVPFRAKDVAAERTEFGHPDLAIILTHLSYYYSGLSDSEIEQVFAILRRKCDGEDIYTQWITKMPEEHVPNSFTKFHSVNLKDASEKTIWFDLLRRHKLVVDFWLSNVVLPKECKQFPEKLVMTAADLVYERQRLPITGFSGTNDSIVLLPLTIKQQDLRDLNDQPEHGPSPLTIGEQRS